MNGLIGKNVSYSFSPVIHELINDYKYKLFNTENINIIKTLEFDGVNITNPYKRDVIKYIDFIDEKAQKLHSVNTVIKRNNKLYGYNTDYFGFKQQLIKAKYNVQDKNILILGNGATANVVSQVLIDSGATNIKFLVRTIKNANEYLYGDRQEVFNAHLIINTTPVGNALNEAIPFNLELNAFTNLELVIDLNYNPLNSQLLRNAKNLNIKSLNGLYMLVAQAVKSNSLLFEDETLLNNIDNIYTTVLMKYLNIVLIGMPGSGKTTIGKVLSNTYNKPLLDSDELLERKHNFLIQDYLNKETLTTFRKLEHSLIVDLANKHNKIIATGGGVGVNHELIDKLQKNSVIIFLDRSLDILYKQDYSKRPLITSKDTLTKTYCERIEKYKAAAHIIVANNDSINSCIKKIRKDINEYINNQWS